LRRGLRPPFVYMGLFSSKTKHYVASESVPLIGGVEDPIKETLMSTILGDRSFTDALVDDSLNGSGIRINRAYRYGRDHFTYGLPQGYTEYFETDDDALVDTLMAIEGKVVTLMRVNVDHGEAENFVVDWLKPNRGLNTTTYEISNIHGAITTQKNNQYTASVNQANSEMTADAASIKAGIDDVEVTDDKSFIVDFRDPDYYHVETNNRTTVTTVATVTPDTVTVTDDLTVLYDPSLDVLVDRDTGEYDIGYAYTIDQTITKDFDISTTETTQVDVVVTETLCDQFGVFLEPLDQTVDTTPGTPSDVVTPSTQQIVTTPAFVGTHTETTFLTYSPEKLYYHVLYNVPDGSGGKEYKEWTYDPSTNVYPALNIGVGVGSASPFYPIVPFRRNNADLSDPSRSGTGLYQTSEKLLKKLNINFAELGAGINENPDIDEVDHAYLFFGTSIHTENQAAIRYLAMFFENMATSCPYSEADYDAGLLSHTYQVNDPVEGGTSFVHVPASGPPSWNFRIEDAGLKYEIVCHYIDVTHHSGSIGNKGHATRAFTILPRGLVETFAGDGEIVSIYTSYEQSYVTFEYQDSPTTYTRIKVHGLVHHNYVYSGYKVTTNLEDSTNGSMLIPLQYNVVSEMPLIQRNFLFQDAFQMVFNSHVAVKVKWYQTGLFRFGTIVVGFIWMAYTGDFSALKVAIAAGASAVAIYLIQQIVISIIWQQVFKVLAKAIGAEWAAALAAVVAFAAKTGVMDTKSLPNVPFAEDLLNALPANIKDFTSGFFDNFGAEFLKGASSAFGGIDLFIESEFDQLKLDLEQFELLKDEQEATLETANELLETSGIIDPFEFIESTGLDPFENPEEFYNRTVHSGNVGALVYDAITHYVDMMLELPKNQYV